MLAGILQSRLLSTWYPVSLGRQHSRPKIRAVHAALYSDGSLTEQPQRPSKSSSKRKAEHLKSLAKQLCRLGPRQLQAVSPILEAEPELVEAISTAKGIDATNQGRKRQEGYVGKLLTSLSIEQQEELHQQLNGMRKKSDRT
ncbi:hypothetical protein ABBQ32_013616 [Trebouxia sp. C0010 RCD-2024]